MQVRYKALGSSTHIRVGFLESVFVMGEYRRNGVNVSYEFKGRGKENSKSIIYNSDLVNKLTEKYSVDYGNSKGSVIFKEVR